MTNANPADVERRFSLLVPGLLDLPVAERETALAQLGQLPALERFLARARQQPFVGSADEPAVEADHVITDHVTTDYASTMFALFGLPVSSSQDTPIAPASYLADAGQPAPAWCLRADPVHLIPDRDQLLLSGPEALFLSQAEAERLATELNTLFEEQGWRLEAVTPTRWYLHLPQDPHIHTTALSTVRGTAISDYLPSGPNGKKWHRIMNEVQMLLHGSAVNRDRQSHGQLTVSSLWFWGGGETPDFGHSQWSKVWSREPVSLGLAQFLRTPSKPWPVDATQLLSEAHSPGEHLIVYDPIAQAYESEGIEAWVRNVHSFNEQWMAPLLAALQQRDINQLSLYSGDGRLFTLSPLGLKRWWRRNKPLARYCVSRQHA
jgi:hypothetical protein